MEAHSFASTRWISQSEESMWNQSNRWHLSTRAFPSLLLRFAS